MTKRMLVRVILAVLIAAVLGGGYAIVLNNGSATGPQSEVSSGFAH